MTKETIKSLVYQALGEASMCWEYPDRGGEFQSDRAKEIGDELMTYIDARIEEANTKNIIEITARCKETTEALVDEAKNEERERYDRCDKQRIEAWAEAKRWKEEAYKLGWVK